MTRRLGGVQDKAAPTGLVGRQRENNRSSADAWERFAPHRAKVTALVLAAGAGGRLAVLGAGNGNDLDLETLTGRFDELHLVDIDAEALGRATDRVSGTARARVRLHAPVDLGGAMDRLGRFRRDPATPGQLAALPGTAVEMVRAALPGPYDVVVSTCFLSQLMRGCREILGARHPQLHLIASALAVAHLRAMTLLLAPDGTAVLVTDMTSSETYPLDELYTEADALGLLARLCEADNAFAGTSASFVQRILREDGVIGAALNGEPAIVAPWLWRFDEERTYLVYAARWRRRAGA